VKRALTLIGPLALAAALGASAAHASTGPLYAVKAIWADSNLPPGGNGIFAITARNVGDATGASDVVIRDELPEHVTATHIHFYLQGGFDFAGRYCSGEGTRTVQCTLPASEMSFFLPAPGDLRTSPSGGGTGFNPEPAGYLPDWIEIEVSIDPAAAGGGVNTATLVGGGASRPAVDVNSVPFSDTPTGPGLAPGGFEADTFDAAFPFGNPSRQAGAHPFEERVNFDLALNRTEDSDTTHRIKPSGVGRTVEVTLPRGLIGNPQAVPKCDPARFAEEGAVKDGTACPPDTQVGYVNVLTRSFLNRVALTRIPLYSLVPPYGTPVDLAFNAGGLVQAHIYGSLDPAQGYAVKAVSPNISSLVTVIGAEVTVWGVPADPAHDFFRFYTEPQKNEAVAGAPWGSAPIRPFFTNPMDCGFENGAHRIRVDFYQDPGQFTPVEEYSSPDNVTGCDDPRFRFEPEVALQPTDRHAGAPTGLDVHLKVPLRNDEVKNATELYPEDSEGRKTGPEAIATPPIKRVLVTFPEGMSLSPSAAQGLSGCSLAQIGIEVKDGRYLPNDNPVQCPDSSQYGKLTLHTPLLPVNEQPEGFIYIAKQDENPFGTFLALYLVIEEPKNGVLVKIPGRVDLDEKTGRMTTTFDELPQLPVSDMQMTFKGGVRAGLVQPTTCGQKTIRAEFFTWQDPSTPHVVTSSYDIAEKPDGSRCVSSLGERPFQPSLQAGTLSASAGEYAPFVLRVSRSDDDQEFSQLGLTLPPGLSANLSSVAQCPQAGIERAQAPGHSGTQEIEDPSCPVSSQIGTAQVGAGVGQVLTYVSGKIYFAGPYQGAPFSVVVITPIVAGPYDLGVVAVRSALYIDPLTAQVRVLTDPFPQIFKGIPVRIRDIRVSVNRPKFMFNPTSCREMTVDAHVTGTGGDLASTADDTGIDLANRFQAGECASLAFKPVFKASTSGKTSRSNGASLHVSLTYPRAPFGTQANIKYVKVDLPKQLPSRLATLQKACANTVFDTNPAACPPASRVGTAKAITPILPVPLEGPAYFVSYGSAKFPELVVVLQGYGIAIDLHGETFISKAGITSSTFRTVPDQPVQSFELTLPQGPYSALAANGNLCHVTTTKIVSRKVLVVVHGHRKRITRKVRVRIAGQLIMPTAFTAQNGMTIHRNTSIHVTGCSHRKAGSAARPPAPRR
jgi:hypothetical protein